MSVFSNKHMVVAMLVAPVLAVLAYFALDTLVGEKPKPAEEGQSYPLVEKPNCRYASGQCGLKNGDFELQIVIRPKGGDRASLIVDSAFPLEGVAVAVIEDVDEDRPPVAMRPQGTGGTSWSLDIPRPDPERHRLRLAASSGGALYYGDVATQFTLQENAAGDSY